jgi:hypothetical protein
MNTFNYTNSESGEEFNHNINQFLFDIQKKLFSNICLAQQNNFINYNKINGSSSYEIEEGENTVPLTNFTYFPKEELKNPKIQQPQNMTLNCDNLNVNLRFKIENNKDSFLQRKLSRDTESASSGSSKQTKKEIIRYNIPFFDTFILTKGKRENIDKTIIRKWKKFLKNNHRSKQINLDHFQNSEFWKSFIELNMAPPFSFKDGNENIEFKSFNTNYLVWLFSHAASIELYEVFIQDQFDNIFLKMSTKFTASKSGKLQTYIKDFAKIFCTPVAVGNEKSKRSSISSCVRTDADYSSHSSLDLHEQ